MTVDVGKLRSLQELVAIVRARRGLGERIVFTNGCFDLLHRGHIRLLQHAKALGNLLIVGLNSDASVRLLKGPSRPVLMQDERAELLSALASVDYVVIFEEPDPGRIIAALEPDVLVKGADWTKEAVIGREAVERRGGQVVTIPLVADCSTSRIVRRIIETAQP